MYRKKQNEVNVNFLFDNGGLGDLIGSLPAIKYVYDHHPHVRIHLWIPDYSLDLCRRSLPQDSERLIIRGFKDKHKYNDKYYGRSFGIHKHTNLGYHQTKQAFAVLVNEEVQDKYLNYLPLKLDDININLSGKFVVMTTGFTANVREFLPAYVNQVVEYCKKKGYEVVFLGKKEAHTGNQHVIKGTFKNEIDYSQGYDLIDKTTLPEAAKIISQAKCIIGLDNGLLHLAGTTKTPIVGGFTTVKPEHRMPYRNNILGWNYYPVVPEESLACRFCQSNWQFTYKHDFKECYYVNNKQDNIIQCVKKLTPILYINELDKIL